MSKQYANPLFGVQQCTQIAGPTGSLAGTNAATTIAVHKFKTAASVIDQSINFIGGGTAATRQLIFNTSLAGTGALVPIGTQVLGTQATNTAYFTGFTATVAAGDLMVVTQLGTDAIAYNLAINMFYNEAFVNA